VFGGYRPAYHPGSAASYLVREVGNQSYASGVLGDYWTQQVRLGLRVFPGRRFSFTLTPEWSIDENPTVVERGIEYRVLEKVMRHELGLEGRFTIRLGKQQAFEAFYKHLFLRSWEHDPFFPIVIPEHGFGLAWHAWSS
jgi:hypothetical protein